MKYKFNPFERAVGLFILVAMSGSLFAGAMIAIKKNWFNEKILYYTTTKSAANIRAGTNVFLSGIKVGKIENIDLDEKEGIKVEFSILKKYSFRMKEGVKAQFARPFLIGDKILTIIPTSENNADLIANSKIPLSEANDVMDILSGNNIEKLLNKVDQILTNINDTLLIGKDLGHQVADKQKVKKLLENITLATNELQKAPRMAADAEILLSNLKQLSIEVNKTMPEAGPKTIKLLEESTVVLQSMQKSWFLRSGVAEVKKENEEKEKNRVPANEASQPK